MSTGKWTKGRKSVAYWQRYTKLKSRYNITIKQYDDLLLQQNNHCALCPTTPEQNGHRLSIDHNHDNNKIRGLLCKSCNALIERIYTTHPEYPKIMDYLRRGLSI